MAPMEETTKPRVFLVVVDESEELQAALHYAARRAAHALHSIFRFVFRLLPQSRTSASWHAR